MKNYIRTPFLFRLFLFLILAASLPFSGLATTVAAPELETNLNQTVRPQDDFYQYAVGGWLDSHPITPDKVIVSSFSTLRDEVDQQLNTILETVAPAGDTPKDEQGKLNLLYRLSLDQARRNRQKAGPLKAELARIDQLKSRRQLTETIARQHRMTGDPLFTIGAIPDFKEPRLTVMVLDQGGVGLPDRSYYLEQTGQKRIIRQKYQEHIASTFRLLGESAKTAEVKAAAIVKLETKLARALLSQEEARDPAKLYHPHTPAELQILTPSIDWPAYFKLSGLKTPKTIILSNPDFYKTLDRTIKETPLNEMKAYLSFHLIDAYAPVLDDRLAKNHRHFHQEIMLGQKQALPPWQVAVNLANATMADALGKEYVRRHYDPATGKQVEVIANNLKLAMRQRLERLDWMTPATKTQALKKLEMMRVYIGQPDRWKDYSNLTIKNDSLAENLMRAHQFAFKEMADKIDRPTDQTVRFTPQTVNLWYSPQHNAIFIPAAVLQAPFFYPEGDLAANYGGLGFTIGHELIHGFDDQGRKFDETGKLRNWWTAADEASFKKKAAVLVRQFNHYAPLPDLSVNGQLTLGENIADLGGLNLAIDAFKQVSLKNAGAGQWFLGMQRFFLYFAQVFRMNVRPETLRLLLLVDPHSPAEFRINGPLSNAPDFYKAFSVRADDQLYRTPTERADIW